MPADDLQRSSTRWWPRGLSCGDAACCSASCSRRPSRRPGRRRDLTRILREGKVSSQADIVAKLRAAGHEVTQATISRDLQELGALKIRAAGGFGYRLPDEMPR